MPMVSLQISEDILKKFDKFQRERGFMSRSEALRAAILNFIKTGEEMNHLKGIRKAVVAIVFSPDLDVLEKISEINHRFSDEIKTYSEHVIDKTIRTYIMVGEVERLVDFLKAFNSLKDVQTDLMFL
jgi:metal-responsive CopG/Arc/MetJ family transcriptional regulator